MLVDGKAKETLHTSYKAAKHFFILNT